MTTKKTTSKQTAEECKINITVPTYSLIAIPIIGTSDYLQNHLTYEKALEINKKSFPPKTVAPKKYRDLDAEYKSNFYMTQAGKNGVPVGAIWSAIETSCVGIENLYKTVFKRAVRIIGNDYYELSYKRLVRFSAPTKNSGKTGAPNVSDRPRFEGWGCIPCFEIDEQRVPISSLINLIIIAGSEIGIGPWRQSLKGRGRFGRFTVDVDRMNTPSWPKTELNIISHELLGSGAPPALVEKQLNVTKRSKLTK